MASSRLLKKIIVLFGLLSAAGTMITACVEKIELDIQDSGSLLSVNGRLTNVDSCYLILRRTASKLSAPQYIPISDARVTVIENGKTDIPFAYSEHSSAYLPLSAGFRGQPGNTYQLKIVLGNGDVYLSTTDTMKTADPVKRIENKFQVDNSGLIPYPQVNQHARMSKQEKEEHFFHFQYIHYVKAKYCASCVIYSRYDLVDNLKCPSPFKSCNQTIREEYKLMQPYDFYGFPCLNPDGCWNYLRARDYKLFTDKYIPLNSEYTVLFGKVPYTTFTKYFLELHLTRISKQAYAYYTALEQAGIKSGSLFDPVPGLLTGNVYHQKDPKIKALGYFVVGGQAVMGNLVNRAEIGSGPLAAARDEDVEFVEKIRTDAPYLYCNFLPMAACVVTDYRTDKRPVGWVD